MRRRAGSRRATEPTIAGRYELSERLGSGVWAARDVRLKRDVAVKLLSSDAESRRRFEAAARSAANLSHANVVLIYDSGEHDGRPFLVMERLPGRTLADEMAEGPLSAERARSVAEDVLAALGAAHAAGIVHGDLKPSDVLLAANGRAKVADFGIGADGAATPASDLHSLGIMLREGLHISDRHPKLPSRLVTAVERAVDEDPSRRFTSAAEMAEALLDPPAPAAAPLTTELPVSSPTVPIDVPAAAPATDRRPLIIAGVAVLAVFLLTWITRTGDGDGASPTVAATTLAPQPLPAGAEAIPAGYFRTGVLRPGLDFTLGAGWSVSGTEADDLVALRRPAADGPELSFLAVERVFRADGRYATSADYVASDSAQPAPGLVDWLRRHPRLRAAEPAAATVGGVGATRIDVEVVDGYPSQVCAGPCVLLFALAAERPNYRVVKLEAGRRMRLYVVGSGDRTIVISIVAPVNGFERSIAEAESVVKSIRLRG